METSVDSPINSTNHFPHPVAWMYGELTRLLIPFGVSVGVDITPSYMTNATGERLVTFRLAKRIAQENYWLNGERLAIEPEKFMQMVPVPAGYLADKEFVNYFTRNMVHEFFANYAAKAAKKYEPPVAKAERANEVHPLIVMAELIEKAQVGEGEKD